MKHVVKIPLKASSNDIQRVQFLMKCSGSIRNATLGTMISRVEKLRRDRAWRVLATQPKSKQRTDQYNQLKRDYLLSEFDCIRIAQQHSRDSGWLADHLDGRIINSIGKEVWTSVNQWLHGQAGKPRFTSANERTILSGNDQRAGLRYKNGYIVHTTAAINKALREKKPLGEKILKIRVDWEDAPKKRRSYYRNQEDKIKKVSLVLNQGKLEAHLVYDCLPYRHEDKINRAKDNLNKQVGFDLGPSTLAFVSPADHKSGIIQPQAKLRKQIDLERKKRRRIQRALQRSRQQTNPECYQRNGQYIPGKKIRIRSKNYLQLQDKLRESYKNERNLISEWHNSAAEQLTSLGLELITENDTIKQWQEGDYGKSVTTLAPAALKERIFHEVRVLREHHSLDAENIELNTYTTCLSQTCVCGKRAKKELRERVHSCQNKDCLLYQIPLHRDKFSALLGLWVKELGIKTYSSGKKTLDQKLGVKKLLNKTYHTQEHRTVAIELCSIGSLDHNPGITQDSMSSTTVESGQVKTSSRQARAKRVTSKSSLSRPSRSLAEDRDGRVNHLNATNISNTEKLGKASGV
jgi:hypothetical protein